MHVQHLAELGRVDDVDLQEEHIGRPGTGLRRARLVPFCVLGRLAGFGPVGDEVEPTVVCERSAMNRRAVSSNSMRSARISVVRETREIREMTTMPRMNSAEMASPSGFSMMFATSA